MPTSPCVFTIQQQGKQIVRWANVKLGGFDQAKHNTCVDVKIHYLELNNISISREIVIMFFYMKL